MPPSLRHSCLQTIRLVIFSVIALIAPAQASDHGGGAPAAEPIKFMINLGNPGTNGRFLVFAITPEGSPEVTQAINIFRPRVMHNLILMLSEENAANLLTLQGKRDLADKIVDEINKSIDETEKTGVHGILFTSFIIQ